MYRGLGAEDLAPNDPILSGEGSGECSPFEDMFFMCDYQQDPAAHVPTYTAPIGPLSARKPGIAEWLKANSTAVYAGTGILVLMAMFGGKKK